MLPEEAEGKRWMQLPLLIAKFLTLRQLRGLDDMHGSALWI